MNTASQVKEAFEKASWKFKYIAEQPDGSTIMAAGFNGEKTVTNLLIHIDAQDHTVMIRAADIAKVPIDRKYDVLVVLNQLNEKYRWSRFYVDGNETINVQTDQILAGESSGAIVMELILRINSIVNEAFPEIMKAIWG